MMEGTIKRIIKKVMEKVMEKNMEREMESRMTKDYPTMKRPPEGTWSPNLSMAWKQFNHGGSYDGRKKGV